MAEYIPSTRDWVRGTGGAVRGQQRRRGDDPARHRPAGHHRNHRGNKTGAVRKTPLMRVKDEDNYVLVGSMGGAPKNPVWVYNLRADGSVQIRDEAEVYDMRVSEVFDDGERARLWALAVAAYPPYEEYQQRTSRKIPVFIAEPA